jgi:glycosyltransferase involved in cell wall biosynthesis
VLGRGVLVDGYYGPYLDFDDFADVLRRAPAPVARLARVGPVRGVLLFLESLRRPAVVVVRVDPGWRSLLLLRALLGRRPKLVALQFLLLAAPAGGWRRRAELLWRRVDRWAVPRAVRTACVLTAWEAGEYADHYEIDRDRVRHVPWPWRDDRAAPVPDYAVDGGVLAGGRAFCDWPTLSRAAAGADWPLTVVCAACDLGAVSALPWPASAVVLSDLAAPDYMRLLGESALAVLAMTDGHTSQAQIRLMHACDAGVPVVASDVAGLAGYVVPGETAVLVPPGDSAGLRRAIDDLLGAPDRRRALREAALARSAAWTGQDYGRALEAVIRGEPARLPHGCGA